MIQLSTSQWVALLTAIPAAAAYGVYTKAAEAHPESAMSLRLEEYEEKFGAKVKDVEPVASAETATEASDVALSEPQAADDAVVPDAKAAAIAEGEKGA